MNPGHDRLEHMKNEKRCTFFGRTDLLGQLEDLWAKRVPSFVTCRGRRRVGKSTLIEEFARRSGARFLKLEGLKPNAKMSNADELSFFASKLSAQSGCPRQQPKDWYEAFVLLDSQLKGNGRKVVLLDEVSWMGHFDHTFTEVLKSAWDDLFKKHANLVFVVCGSVSSWIRENIIDNGAYVGRRSLDVVVPELPLDECVKFWGRRAERVAPREIIDVLSVTGGIPRYLEEIRPSLSAAENIRRLCFMPKSYLREDFDDMFKDVITKRPKFSCEVLRQFVDGPKSCAEVAAAMGTARSGGITEAVDILSEAGFLAEEGKYDPETGLKMRERRFRLKDNYVRFYLKYVEPFKDAIDDGSFAFTSLEELDGIDSIMGLAFENLVVNNYRAILPFMNLNGALITSAGPFRRKAPRGVRGKPGCQVDLMIQTRRAIWFVEVKRMREISRDVISEVDRKVRAVKRPAEVSAKTALVYDGHLSPVAKADGYFDAIIPFSKLLGL